MLHQNMSGHSWRWSGLLSMGATLLLAQAGVAQETNAKLNLSGTIRVQWSDRQGAASQDGFETRMARLTGNYRHDETLAVQVMIEFASGDRANGAELLEAFAVWRSDASTQWYVGQYPLPLFYELRTRLPRQETLERGALVSTYFAGACGYGIYAERQLSKHYAVEVGAWNSLTLNDPQRVMRGGHAAIMGGVNVRHSQPRYGFSIGGVWGKRPSFTTRDAQNNPLSVPQTPRRLWYVENELRDIPLQHLTVRWTEMWGRDRNPAGGVNSPQFLTAADYRGTVLCAIYTPCKEHQLVVRWEQFDPNTTAPNDGVRTLGMFYHFFPRRGIRLTAGYQINDEQGTEIANNRFFLTAQYQF